MKKPIHLVALTLALTLLSGCSAPLNLDGLWPETLQVPTESSASSTTGSQSSAAVQRGDYQSLPNDCCRRLYQKLLNNAGKITAQKDASGYLIQSTEMLTEKPSDQEIRLTVMALLNDNPQIFWVSNHYTYAYSLTGVRLQLYSHLSAAERNSGEKELNTVVSGLLPAIRGGKTELAREEAAFYALAGRCTYDQTVADAGTADPKDWQPYTVYGALVKGKAVCDGYARAMQLLCGQAGLQSRLVNGSSKGTAHIWNLIRLDGKWYHFDATWMDGSILTYSYFNVNDAVIKKDHSISPSGVNAADCNLPLPTASSMDDNYFRKCAVQVRTLDNTERHQVATALVKAVRDKHSSFAMVVSDKVNYNATVEKLFSSEPFFFESCVRLANTALPADSQLSYEIMQYSQAAALHGLSIRLAHEQA